MKQHKNEEKTENTKTKENKKNNGPILCGPLGNLLHFPGWLSARCCVYSVWTNRFQEQLEKMYATMVYKDKKLLEINNKLLETDKVIMDLQETILEKDEVIKGRDKAIKVRSIEC